MLKLLEKIGESIIDRTYSIAAVGVSFLMVWAAGPALIFGVFP